MKRKAMLNQLIFESKRQNMPNGYVEVAIGSCWQDIKYSHDYVISYFL